MYYYWFGGNSFKLGSVFCFLSILTSCLDVLMKDNLLTNFNILNLLYTDIRPHVLNLKAIKMSKVTGYVMKVKGN
jgi:hypothetical protein